MLQNLDRFYGAAFELPLFLLTERVLGLEDPRHVYLTRHVLTHLLFLIGGFCCYLLSPRLYAHSFFNSKDPVFASAFVMALLFASRAFDRDSLGAYRWCGAAAGLLVNLRVMGVVLFAVVLVFRAWAWFRAEGPAARRRDWARRRWRWRRSILTSISISTSWRTGKPQSGYSPATPQISTPWRCGKVTSTY